MHSFDNFKEYIVVFVGHTANALTLHNFILDKWKFIRKNFNYDIEALRPLMKLLEMSGSNNV